MGSTFPADKEYNPATLHFQTGAKPQCNVPENNVYDHREQGQASLSEVMSKLPITHENDAIKLHIKAEDWYFSFEGSYTALCKTIESLGDISEHMSHPKNF